MTDSPETQSPRTLRPRLFAVFFALLAAGSVLALLANLSLHALGYTLPGVVSWPFVRVLMIAYLWALICTPVCVLMFSVRLDDEGLTARTFWGKKRSVAWTDMAAVKTVGGIVGFWVVKTHTPGAPLWVSRFIQQPEMFEGYIKK